MENRHYFDTVEIKNSPKTNVFIIALRSILLAIALVLVSSTLYRLASGTYAVPTFSGFLDMIQNIPQIDFKSSKFFFTDLTIKDNWGPFDFLRNFINTIVLIFSILVFVCLGLAQLVVVLTYVLGFFFGV